MRLPQQKWSAQRLRMRTRRLRGRGSEKGKKDEKPKKTLEEMVADYELIEGFFNLYRNPENGSMFMAVRADQLDREFVYFSYAENGVKGIPRRLPRSSHTEVSQIL